MSMLYGQLNKIELEVRNCLGDINLGDFGLSVNKSMRMKRLYSNKKVVKMFRSIWIVGFFVHLILVVSKKDKPFYLKRNSNCVS